MIQGCMSSPNEATPIVLTAEERAERRGSRRHIDAFVADYNKTVGHFVWTKSESAKLAVFVG